MWTQTVEPKGFRAAALLLATALVTGCTGQTVSEAPGATDIQLAPETELIAGAIPLNTTLEMLFTAHGLTTEVARKAIAAVRGVFDPRRLRASQPFELERTPEGELDRFSYEIDADTYLHVTPEPSTGTLDATLRPIPKTREAASAVGRIGGATPSLYQAMEAAGERPELTIAMAEVFAGEVDFNTELQPGDSFGLVFEKFTRENRPASYGAIEAAELRNDGRVLRAIRFTPPGGKPGYYDEEGRSLRRFFLRSPLKFEPRITSGFSRNRFHPVLKTRRPHLGVDYGAPVGTPVIAVASGRVVSATSDNTNGRMVRLRHSGGYETYYLHLSRFGAGIRPGVAVTQGQVIGHVGATGLATGPHLDYRVRRSGTFVDPVREHRRMPPGEPVPAEAREAFEAVRARAIAALEEALQQQVSPAAPATAARADTDPDAPSRTDTRSGQL